MAEKIQATQNSVSRLDLEATGEASQDENEIQQELDEIQKQVASVRQCKAEKLRKLKETKAMQRRKAKANQRQRTRLISEEEDSDEEALLEEELRAVQEEIKETKSAKESRKEKLREAIREEKEKLQKIKGNSQQITLKELRKMDKLQAVVNNQMETLGLENKIGKHSKPKVKGTKKSEKECKIIYKQDETSSDSSDEESEVDSDDHRIKTTCMSRAKKIKQRKCVSPSDSDSSDSSETDSKYLRRKHKRNKNKIRKQVKKHYRSPESSDDSSSSEDLYAIRLAENMKSKKKQKSGIEVKSTDEVKNAQKWPHSALQNEFAGKTLKFSELTFSQFVAGELETLSLKSLGKRERKGRLEFLKKLVYYTDMYEWGGILELYAAWVRKIEIGQKKWSDDPIEIETRILNKYIKPVFPQTHLESAEPIRRPMVNNSVVTDRGDNQTNTSYTWFCPAFQRNKCQHKTSHLHVIRGQMRQCEHVCATCLMKDRLKLPHPECSSACPNTTA